MSADRQQAADLPAMRDAWTPSLLRLAGLLLSVLPPAAATLSCFPLWRERGSDAVLSGCTLLLLLLCALPLWRQLRRALRSPCAWMIWGALLLLFHLLSAIADEMVLISTAGLIGNLLGAVLFRLARRRQRAEGRGDGHEAGL